MPGNTPITSYYCMKYPLSNLGLVFGSEKMGGPVFGEFLGSQPLMNQWRASQRDLDQCRDHTSVLQNLGQRAEVVSFEPESTCSFEKSLSLNSGPKMNRVDAKPRLLRLYFTFGRDYYQKLHRHRFRSLTSDLLGVRPPNSETPGGSCAKARRPHWLIIVVPVITVMQWS